MKMAGSRFKVSILTIIIVNHTASIEDSEHGTTYWKACITSNIKKNSLPQSIGT